MERPPGTCDYDSSDEIIPANASRPVRVLFADPGSSGADEVAAALQSAGFQVDRVADLTGVRDSIVHGIPHVALVAIGSGSAPDAEEMARVFLDGEAYSQVGLVVACGRYDAGVRDRLIEDGAIDAVVRPYDPSEVPGRIKAAVRIVRLIREVARSRRLAAVGELALRLDHDVLNPLAGIRGHAELIQVAPVPDEVKSAAKGIVELAERIGETVGKMAKIREGR